MKKRKKTEKVETQETTLDRLAKRLRVALQQGTISIIEAGRILLESRELLEHGQWLPWLTENFDLSERTAQRYTAAAEYVISKSDTTSDLDFANLAPTVLYRLAAGGYAPEEEAEILAQAKAGARIDDDRAWDICEKLKPPPPADDLNEVDEDRDHEDDGDDGGDDDDGEDTEPANEPPPNEPQPQSPVVRRSARSALRNFDETVGAFKPLMTMAAATFDGTRHDAAFLENVEVFIKAVRVAKAKAWAESAEDSAEKRKAKYFESEQGPSPPANTQADK